MNRNIGIQDAGQYEQQFDEDENNNDIKEYNSGEYDRYVKFLQAVIVLCAILVSVPVVIMFAKYDNHDDDIRDLKDLLQNVTTEQAEGIVNLQCQIYLQYLLISPGDAYSIFDESICSEWISELARRRSVEKTEAKDGRSHATPQPPNFIHQSLNTLVHILTGDFQDHINLVDQCFAEVKDQISNVAGNFTTDITEVIDHIDEHDQTISEQNQAIQQKVVETCEKAESINDHLGIEVPDPNWDMWTRNPDGHAFVPASDTTLTKANAPGVTHKCDLPLGNENGSNDQIVIHDDQIFFTTGPNGGEVRSYNRETCDLVWVINIAQLFQDHIPAELGSDPINASNSLITSRAMAHFHDENGSPKVLFGAPSNRFYCITNGNSFCQDISAYMISVDASTGAYAWHVKVADKLVPEDFLGHLTGGATLSNNVAYFGTASFGNIFAGFGLPCLHIGQLIALNLHTQTVKWTTRTLPPHGGVGGNWCGASVWARVSVDEELGLVFAGTGQGHFHPQDVEDNCFANFTTPNEYGPALRACHDYAKAQYNHPILTSSVFAVRIDDGSFYWTNSPLGLDVWSYSPFPGGCPKRGPNARTPLAPAFIPGTGCQGFNGPDWDFAGQFSIIGKGVNKIIAAVGKSGIAYGFDALTGETKWSVDLGAGSNIGGGHWSGSYSPTEHLFYATNSGADSDPLATSNYLPGQGIANAIRFVGSSYICNTGSVNAIDPDTGHVVWRAYHPEGTFAPSFAALSPDCQAAVQPDGVYTNMLSTGIFKNGLVFKDVFGAANYAANTATLATNCASYPTTPGPIALGSILASGYNAMTPVTESGVLVATSRSGTAFFLDSGNGNCIHAVGCPSGVIYGAASIAGRTMAMMCGNNYGIPLPTTSNVTRVFEIPA